MILIPISNGELLDKLTILEIKKEQIFDKIKLEKVHNEYNLLKKIYFEKSLDKYNNLYNELKKVNKILWKIEDDIREKEYKKEFDEEFIKLARSVYIENDNRFQLKDKINKLSKSSIHEVKSYNRF